MPCCTYVIARAHTHTYTHTHTHTHVHTNTCTYTHTCIHTYGSLNTMYLSVWHQIKNYCWINLNGIHKHTLTFSFIWDQNIADTRSRALKRPYWSRCEIKLGAEYSCIWYICLKCFGHDDLIAKYCYSGCSRPPDVDGIKIFTKNKYMQPGHLHQKLWFHQRQEALSAWNNNVLQGGHHDQNFHECISETLAAHFNFSN